MGVRVGQANGGGAELHRGFENERLPAGLLGLLQRFAKRVAKRVLESRRVARRGCCTGGYCKRVLCGGGGGVTMRDVEGYYMTIWLATMVSIRVSTGGTSADEL